MAGRPFLDELCRLIDSLGGDDWVFSRMADGQSVGAIAAELAPLMSTKSCDRRNLYFWRDRKEGRAAEWTASMKAAGSAYAEQGGKILDDLANQGTFGAQDVTLAAKRAEWRMKMAGALDRETFGDAPAVSLTVDIGQLHLEALRAKGSMSLAKPEPLVLEGHTEPDEAA